MSNIKKIISTTSIFLLILTSNYIQPNGIPYTEVDGINIGEGQLTKKVDNPLSAIKEDDKNKEPEIPIVDSQDEDESEEELKKTNYYEETAIAGSTVLGATSIGAGVGAIIGGVGGFFTGNPVTTMIVSAKVGAAAGTGCGMKIAVNNFNKKEKSLASKVTTECGKATLVGAATASIAFGIPCNPFAMFGAGSLGYLAPNAVNSISSEKGK